MKRSESKRPGVKPVLKNGRKWPHVTLHAAPAEAVTASLSSTEALQPANLDRAVRRQVLAARSGYEGSNAREASALAPQGSSASVSADARGNGFGGAAASTATSSFWTILVRRRCHKCQHHS
jgi:hypothetical protein